MEAETLGIIVFVALLVVLVVLLGSILRDLWRRHRWGRPDIWRETASELGLTVEETEHGCRLAGTVEGREVEVTISNIPGESGPLLRPRKGAPSKQILTLKVGLQSDCWDGFILSGGSNAPDDLAILSPDSLPLEMEYSLSSDVDDRVREILADRRLTSALEDFNDLWPAIRLEDNRLVIQNKRHLLDNKLIDPKDFKKRFPETMAVARLLEQKPEKLD